MIRRDLKLVGIVVCNRRRMDLQKGFNGAASLYRKLLYDTYVRKSKIRPVVRQQHRIMTLVIIEAGLTCPKFWRSKDLCIYKLVISPHVGLYLDQW